MNFFRRFLAAWRFAQFTPWVEQPVWLAEDAKGLQAYLASASGEKLKLYMRNFILRSQSDALSNLSNLTYSAGECNGAKNLWLQLDLLKNPQNFTAEDTSASEVS